MALKIKTLAGLVNAALHIKTAAGIVPVNLHAKTADGIALLSGGAEKVLRYATHRNKYPDAFATTSGSLLRGYSYYDAFIGSGDVYSLVPLFWNTIANSTGEVDNTNPVTIESMSIERVSVPSWAPVYFSGSRSVTLAAGAQEIAGDPVLPAAFGLSKFTRGEQYKIKVIWSVSAAGHKVPTCRHSVEKGTQRAWRFDPAVTLGITTDATGPFTYTGVAPTAEANPGKGVCPIIVGLRSANDKVFHTTGDSIVAGANSLDGPTLFQWAFENAPSGIYANGEVSVVGGRHFIGTDIRNRALYKYANILCDENGTNAITSGVPSTYQAIYSAFRAAGGKRIIRTKITPKTFSSSSVISASNVGTTARIYTSAKLPTVGMAIKTVNFTPAAYNRSTPCTAVGDGYFEFAMTSDPGGPPSVIGLWSDIWKTEENQQYHPESGPGSAQETFNNAMQSLKDAGEVDVLIPLDALRGVDFYKWKAIVPQYPNDSWFSATAPGIHPTNAASAAAGAEIVPYIESISL